MVRADAFGLGRHLGRLDRPVLGFRGRDVLVDGFAPELSLYGLLDVGGDALLAGARGSPPGSR
ncbi:hypothetical protein [Kitasatospora sp. NPDC057223]|uniref:hypothetical protein n=1 Tax=Kitasatospora sp. NPDC057223 TaxID=3346055 RepID=UPI003628F3DE